MDEIDFHQAIPVEEYHVFVVARSTPNFLNSIIFRQLNEALLLFENPPNVRKRLVQKLIIFISQWMVQKWHIYFIALVAEKLVVGLTQLKMKSPKVQIGC